MQGPGMRISGLRGPWRRRGIRGTSGGRACTGLEIENSGLFLGILGLFLGIPDSFRESRACFRIPGGWADLGDEEGFVGPVAAERVLFHVPLLLDPDRHVACQQNQDEISFAVELGQFDYFPGV